MTDNQIAREIIRKLRKEGMVVIEDGEGTAILAYGKKIKEQFRKHHDNRADQLEDDLVYYWKDSFELIDWTYLVDGDIRCKESVWHLEQMVRDYEWEVIA